MSGPLKILVAGGPTYVIGVNQAKWDALARTGEATVGLYTPERWPIPGWNAIAPLERASARFDYFPTRVWLGFRRGGHLYPPGTFRRALRAFRPDLVHIELESFALGAWELGRLAARAGIPYGLFCWENTDRPLSAIRRATRRDTLARAACAVAGNAEAAALLRRWGLAGPVEVMPQMGVDPAFFAPRPVPAGPDLTVAYLGRLVPEKGVDVLLDAVAAVCARGARLRMLVCGGGPAQPDLEARAARLGLGETVTWRTAVPHAEVPDVLAGVHALVLPSRSVPGWMEQFGHVLVEAMAMGRPVLGSTCGEIPRVIGRPDAVFPEGDATALADLLERLARDGTWRDDLSAFGLARVREHYTHERIARRLVAFWRAALREKITE